jgi:hypothetical protein
MTRPNLEHDLIRNISLCERVQTDREFAKSLYAALCNTEFHHAALDEPWGCSWRYAGGILANIENTGGDYLDYYCSGNEGHVTDELRAIFAEMGWDARPYRRINGPSGPKEVS